MGCITLSTRHLSTETKAVISAYLNASNKDISDESYLHQISIYEKKNPFSDKSESFLIKLKTNTNVLNFPDDLKMCIKYAQQLNANFIEFDINAAPCEELIDYESDIYAIARENALVDIRHKIFEFIDSKLFSQYDKNMAVGEILDIINKEIR